MQCGHCKTIADSRAAAARRPQPHIQDGSEKHYSLTVEALGHQPRALLHNKHVSLFCVKAHVGLDGNERAGQLARGSALMSKRKPNYDRYDRYK
ncbi:unnamed protein product [Euphydryas editha]|uniref:RNase H type-1 domain-containing protein n=1 Tax=Euphydryas editha TaxID=104508 RepID=A0AAU9UEL4_EUPED|nr:unnamed protein product [Euphydryas editha]